MYLLCHSAFRSCRQNGSKGARFHKTPVGFMIRPWQGAGETSFCCFDHSCLQPKAFGSDERLVIHQVPVGFQRPSFLTLGTNNDFALNL